MGWLGRKCVNQGMLARDTLQLVYTVACTS